MRYTKKHLLQYAYNLSIVSQRGDCNSFQHPLGHWFSALSPSLILNYCTNVVFNFKSPIFFVNISSIISPVGQYFKRTIPSSTDRLLKCNITSICLFRLFTDQLFKCAIAFSLVFCMYRCYSI